MFLSWFLMSSPRGFWDVYRLCFTVGHATIQPSWTSQVSPDKTECWDCSSMMKYMFFTFETPDFLSGCFHMELYQHCGYKTWSTSFRCFQMTLGCIWALQVLFLQPEHPNIKPCFPLSKVQRSGTFMCGCSLAHSFRFLCHFPGARTLHPAPMLQFILNIFISYFKQKKAQVGWVGEFCPWFSFFKWGGPCNRENTCMPLKMALTGKKDEKYSIWKHCDPSGGPPTHPLRPL